ncbi:hypothetical protein AMTR_s00002p00229520 [Amborella trichopoda]|uniref:Uncharacterized protein n=1 Tax=Amborella trichopoda TaxID=13333 RepID=W1P0P8_AMBTC|nr:hypothetical protein AMTR_s00002p00229520 [Amborella trichopoda]
MFLLLFFFVAIKHLKKEKVKCASGEVGHGLDIAMIPTLAARHANPWRGPSLELVTLMDLAWPAFATPTVKKMSFTVKEIIYPRKGLHGVMEFAM